MEGDERWSFHLAVRTGEFLAVRTLAEDKGEDWYMRAVQEAALMRIRGGGGIESTGGIEFNTAQFNELEYFARFAGKLRRLRQGDYQVLDELTREELLAMIPGMTPDDRRRLSAHFWMPIEERPEDNVELESERIQMNFRMRYGQAADDLLAAEEARGYVIEHQRVLLNMQYILIYFLMRLQVIGLYIEFTRQELNGANQTAIKFYWDTMRRAFRVRTYLDAISQISVLWHARSNVSRIMFIVAVYTVDQYLSSPVTKVIINAGDQAVSMLTQVAHLFTNSYYAPEIAIMKGISSFYFQPILRLFGLGTETPVASLIVVVKAVLAFLSIVAPYVLIIREWRAMRKYGASWSFLAARYYDRAPFWSDNFVLSNEMPHVILGVISSGPTYIIRWACGPVVSWLPIAIRLAAIAPTYLALWFLMPVFIAIVSYILFSEVDGWCYAKVFDIEAARVVLRTNGYAPTITARHFVAALNLHKNSCSHFVIDQSRSIAHLVKFEGRIDWDDVIETLLDMGDSAIGMMGSWRMTRSEVNPVARLHHRVKNTADSVIRSKGLTAAAGLIARAADFSYPAPFARRTEDLNAVQSLSVLNQMRERNDITKEECVGLTVKAPFLKTNISVHSKAAKMIAERTGIILVHDPSVGGPHEEAVLLRTRFLMMVSEREKNLGAGMLLIAPSVIEMHLFPLAVWLFIEGADGFDVERADGVCSCDAAKVCQVRSAAAQDGRWLVEKSMTAKSVRAVTAKYGVRTALMVHVEPNVKPREILDMQVMLGIEKVYSLMNFAILPMFGHSVVDTVTKHTFVVNGDQIVCGFDSGTYTHDRRDFEAICSVVENGRGQWQKREVMFEVERTVASVLQVATSANSALAIAYRPSLHTFYILPCPAATGIHYILVKRTALDNLLARLATKPKITVEDIYQAARGSSVQLTIAGASISPRFDQGWDDMRSMANFVFLYLNASKVLSKVTAEVTKKVSWLDQLFGISTKVTEYLLNMYGADLPDFTVQQVSDVLAAITEKSRQVSLNRVTELCMIRYFGTATRKVKRTTTPPPRFSDMRSLAQQYARAHDANLSDTIDLTLKISKRWLAENVSMVAEGAVLAQNAWTACWSFAEETFRSKGMLTHAERAMYMRTKYDWTKYNGPEIVRALLECVVGDSLGFMAALKHLVSTVIQSYREADLVDAQKKEVVASSQTVDRYRAAAEEAEAINDGLCWQWFQELYGLYYDDGEAPDLFHGNFFPDGNTPAHFRRSYNQVLDRFLDKRRETLNARNIPFQDMFHSIVTIFGNVRGVTNRASLIDGVIAKVVSDVGQELQPVLKMLAQAVEKKAQEVTAERVEQMRNMAGNERRVEAEDGSVLQVRTLEIGVLDTEGNRIDLEAAARNGNVVEFRGRGDQVIKVQRIPDVGRLTEERMEEIAGIKHDWIGPNGPSRDVTNYFMPTARAGRCLFDHMELNARARGPHVLQEVYDENSFDIEMEHFVRNPDFGELANQVNFFTQSQTANCAPYLAHIRGLPASMKSAFIRKYLDHRDLVIVPSKKLQLEWKKALADMPREQQPRVLTQHAALTSMCVRFAVVDEVYTMGRQQVAAYSKIARGGLITMGDGSQIRVSFQGGRLFDFEHLATYKMQAMLSVIPFDALILYLHNADLSTYDLNQPFISGCGPIRGMKYVVSPLAVLSGDAHCTMNQDGAARVRSQGQLMARTAHELQGARAEDMFVYLDGHQTQAFANSMMHFGVAISRSTAYTTLIIQRGVDYSRIPGLIFPEVNGRAFHSVSHYDATSYLDFCRVDEDDYDTWKDEQEKEWEPAVFQEPFFGEAIKPATFVIDGTTVTMDDAKQELTSTFEVTDTFKKISADWVREKLRTEYGESDSILRGGDFSMLHNYLPRAGKGEKIEKRHRAGAEIIWKRMTEQGVMDEERFVRAFQIGMHLYQNSEKTPHQLRAYLTATGDRKAELYASAFAKNVISKKTAEKIPKVQGITSSNAIVQSLFAQYIFALTFAFQQGLRDGIFLDVGYDDEQLFAIISHLQYTLEGKEAWLSDLEMQDSTHSPDSIAFFSLLLKKGGVRNEIRKALEHVRYGEDAVDINGLYVLTSGTALTSGAPWTLISNIIMMFTAVINKYEIPRDVKFLQKGDDLSANKPLRERTQVYPGRVVFKNTRSRYLDFTSKACIQGHRIRKNMKLFLAMAFSPRTAEKHDAWVVELRNFYKEMETLGIDEWMRLRFEIYAIDPTGSEDIVRLALHNSQRKWEELPRELRLGGRIDMKRAVLISEKEYCAYMAFSFVCGSNNMATVRDRLYHHDVDWQEIRDTAMLTGVRVQFHQGKYPGDGVFRAEQTEFGVVNVWEDHAAVFLTMKEKLLASEGRQMRQMLERGDEISF